jgi:hypothetical protein
MPHVPNLPLPNRQVVLRLDITVGDDGTVNVTGNIGNAPLCLYALEKAKLAILSYDPRKPVEAPVGIDLSHLRAGN